MKTIKMVKEDKEESGKSGRKQVAGGYVSQMWTNWKEVCGKGDWITSGKEISVQEILSRFGNGI